MNAADIAKLIDHTCLSPDATAVDIERLCGEAVRFGFRGVCVAPSRVATAVDLLSGSPIRVGTVVGFPHGDTISRVKVTETEGVVALGADEVDMVMALGALKDGRDEDVVLDISGVRRVVHAEGGRLLKVIVESALLDDEELVRACSLAERAGADYVKTSTGFSVGGATVAAVRLMRDAVGDRLGVKAAGGIRDLSSARSMVEAGASRLGTSASVAIVSPSDAG